MSVLPCGALSLVHQRWKLMTRLTIVLGSLIEALNWGKDLIGAYSIDCLSKKICLIFYIVH